jgi:hypothetical protein
LVEYELFLLGEWIRITRVVVYESATRNNAAVGQTEVLVLVPELIGRSVTARMERTRNVGIALLTGSLVATGRRQSAQSAVAVNPGRDLLGTDQDSRLTVGGN